VGWVVETALARGLTPGLGFHPLRRRRRRRCNPRFRRRFLGPRRALPLPLAGGLSAGRAFRASEPKRKQIESLQPTGILLNP
jgi:hypothetical protein